MSLSLSLSLSLSILQLQLTKITLEDMINYVSISYIFNCLSPFLYQHYLTDHWRHFSWYLQSLLSFVSFELVYRTFISSFRLNKIMRHTCHDWMRKPLSVIQCLPLWLPTLCVPDTLRGLNFRTWYASPIDPIKPDLNFNGCHRKPRSFRCA